VANLNFNRLQFIGTNFESIFYKKTWRKQEFLHKTHKKVGLKIINDDSRKQRESATQYVK